MEPEHESARFAPGYLRRSLGRIANHPGTALTELVANAWDAGAFSVEINVGSEPGEIVSIRDDGTGLTREEFYHRWMELGFQRVDEIGRRALFPPGREGHRAAFGRNGLGRHALLCFSDTYTVETGKNGEGWRFEIETSAGDSPFRVASESRIEWADHGTHVYSRLESPLANHEQFADLISSRFLHDPKFQISFNGQIVQLTDLGGFIESKILEFADYKAEIHCIDSSTSARRSAYHGVAFWVGGRLVGEPSWQVGERVLLDGRTKPAKRYTIVVQVDGFHDLVYPDWSDFKPSPAVAEMYETVVPFVQDFLRQVLSGKAKERKERIIRDYREELEELDEAGKVEVSEFIDELHSVAPAVSAENLELATAALIKLSRSRSGRALLNKLAELEDSSIDDLNQLLEEWTIRDALMVLREIESRIAVIQTLEKLTASEEGRRLNELHSVHPLVTRARWLFGHRFDTPEFAFNRTVRRAFGELLGKKVSGDEFPNPRRRPDLVVLADKSSLSVVATESENEETGLVEVQEVLIVEVKRAGFELSRDEMNQATGYVEDLAASSAIAGRPKIRAFVVGDYLGASVKASPFRAVGDPEYGKIRACTYSQLIQTANRKCFRLKERLDHRADGIPSMEMVERVLSEPVQQDMFN